jgi:hypothetical protein
MAAMKKRKTESTAVNVQRDENEAFINLIVEKLSMELNPILGYISHQLVLKEQADTALSETLKSLTAKINSLEARFFKIEKEIADLQIHALHGFGLQEETQAPYAHW